MAASWASAFSLAILARALFAVAFACSLLAFSILAFVLSWIMFSAIASALAALFCSRDAFMEFITKRIAVPIAPSTTTKLNDLNHVQIFTFDPFRSDC